MSRGLYGFPPFGFPEHRTLRRRQALLWAAADDRTSADTDSEASATAIVYNEVAYVAGEPNAIELTSFGNFTFTYEGIYLVEVSMNSELHANAKQLDIWGSHFIYWANPLVHTVNLSNLIQDPQITVMGFLKLRHPNDNLEMRMFVRWSGAGSLDTWGHLIKIQGPIFQTDMLGLYDVDDA